MATFRKTGVRKKNMSSGRTFHKRKAASFPSLVTSAVTRKKVDSDATLPLKKDPSLDVDEELKKAPKPEETHASPPPDRQAEPEEETAAQLSEISRMIKQASARLSQIDDEGGDSAETPIVEGEDEPQPPEETADPDQFNGLSSEDEKMELLQAQLDSERRRAEHLKHQLELIEGEFEKEKGHLHKEVHELKKEMHRTAPIQDTKFFSLSRELREAVDAIHSLQNEVDEPMTTSDTGSIASMIATKPDAETFKPTLAPATPPPTTPSPPPPAPTPAAKEKEDGVKEVEKPAIDPAAKKKKLMITGGAAVAVLLMLSTGLSLQLTRPPKTGATNQYAHASPTPAAGQVKGVSDKSPEEKYAQAQADVTFENTSWETIQEPFIGVKLQSPANAVNIIKTDSSLTFIRKTGYIFKIQKIETGLELKEYWKQIQATSLNYVVSDTTFKGKKALFLELNDTTDYPGNRYLVKQGNFILDVWYAAPSSKFVTDDIKRAEKMLDSLEFI